MVHHNNSHQGYPNFGPGIRVIRRIPKNEYEKSVGKEPQTSNDISFDEKDLGVWDALRTHGISGLTAGYSDEIQAANEAGFTDYWRGDKKAEETYNRRVAKERAYQKALQEKHPIWSTGAYIAGSILPTLASFGIPGLNFLRAGSTLGGLGKGMIVGAGSGALHGSGAGEGYNDTVNSALAAGAGGAVLAPVGSLVGMGVSKIGRSIGNAVKDDPFVERFFNPAHKQVSNQVLRRVARELYDDKAPDIIERLRSEPDMFLTDINPKLRKALFAASQTNKDVSNILAQAHEKRLGGSVQRLDDIMDKKIAPYQHKDTFERALKESAEKAHGHLYREVMATPIKGKQYYRELDKLFGNKSFKKAVNEAAKNLKDHMRKANPKRFNSKSYRHINYRPTMELLDETKKVLDEWINKSKNYGEMQNFSKYQSIKEALVAITDKISPTYKTARASAEKYKVFAESFDKGQQAFSKSLEKSEVMDAAKANRLKGILKDKNNTYHNDNSYRMGVRNKLHSILHEQDAGFNELINVLGKNAASENLKRIIGPKRFATFKKAVDQEKFYSDAAKKGFDEFTGNPEFYIFDGVRSPNSFPDTATQAFKLARNIFYHPNSSEILKARQEIERGIAKLATFGVEKMSPQEIAKLIQSTLKWHKAGVIADDGMKIISRAITKGLGPNASIEYAK
ncbi:glycine zipper family protein [Bartonella sp. 220]|uniref:glycine zipper family protein n=1 Tax=Bartonella sp. 220B TaxID=2967260 RepID=UPI0022A9C4AC|nr:glycine zipper family protein [Bartonella sp. 220B]MCZ2159257.1 glycine zipper family protein [Bartonella sp. 220B]